MTELTNLWDSTRDLYTRFDVPITLAQLLSAMRHVTLKNDSKTLQTHAVNAAGKIARKG